jgi:hypothetical protein
MTESHMLIVPHYAEAVNAFLNVLLALRETATPPLVLVQANDSGTLALCEQHGFATEILPDFAWHHGLHSIRQALTEPLHIRRYTEEILRRRGIKGMLLVDDRRYIELFLIHAARKRRIPSMVLMWAATNSSQDMTRWRQKSHSHLDHSRWRWLKPLIRRVAPQALREIDGQEVYWQHPLAVLTLWLLADYPPQPWILGGGTADTVAVMGAFYRDLLISEGIAPAKIQVTGHPRHDDIVHLAAQWRQNLPAKPSILLAAPPIAHIKAGTRGGHITMEQANAALHGVIEQLLELPYDLMVKPHPRDVGSMPDYLQNHRRDIRIAGNEPVAPLLARAALLVCQGSSVVLDACGLDVPVVTFDFYDTPGYDMWGKAGASVHVTDPAQILPSVQAALTDPALQSQLREQRQNFVARYMRLDGEATKRVLLALGCEPGQKI